VAVGPPQVSPDGSELVFSMLHSQGLGHAGRLVVDYCLAPAGRIRLSSEPNGRGAVLDEVL
jgi:hypothetical protein